MGRNKEPVDLVIAKGKKHLTRDEIDKRRAEELKVPFKDVKAPDYLSAKQVKEFNKIASMLLKLNIFTELDVDCLASYILSKDLYLTYTRTLSKKMEKLDLDEISKLQNLQDKVFKQCLASSKEMGLTIISRCKIVIPQIEDDDDEL